MITAGVDLATEPARTALATVEWTSAGARVLTLSKGPVDDAAITDAAKEVAVMGVDCPLGWPDDFVTFLQNHQKGDAEAPENVAGKDWRRRLAYRATDRAVYERTGITPLSVSTDRIDLTAMRAAGLLARLRREGQPVDRAGAGVVVEVYPAASLKCWGLAHRGYKRGAGLGQLEALVAALTQAAPWLDLGPYTERCSESDDAFDAVIAALTARAVALKSATTPEDDTGRARARREGWIALPTAPLSSLVGGSNPSG